MVNRSRFGVLLFIYIMSSGILFQCVPVTCVFAVEIIIFVCHTEWINKFVSSFLMPPYNVYLLLQPAASIMSDRVFSRKM